MPTAKTNTKEQQSQNARSYAFGNIIVGLLSGLYLGPGLMVIVALIWHFIVYQGSYDKGTLILSTLLLAWYWVAFGALTGACSGFLGGRIKRYGGSIIPLALVSMITGIIVFVLGLFVVATKGAPKLFDIPWLVASGIIGVLTGLLGSYYDSILTFMFERKTPHSRQVP